MLRNIIGNKVDDGKGLDAGPGQERFMTLWLHSVVLCCQLVRSTAVPTVVTGFRFEGKIRMGIS